MLNQEPERIFASLIFVLLLVGFHMEKAGAAPPPVSPRYEKFFKHYVDKRSYTEKFLNAIGLTNDDIGRSFALIAGVSFYPNIAGDKELKPAAEDIRKLKKYLIKKEFFDEVVVLKNGDMTMRNLKYFLEVYFPERLKQFPKSRFLFAYSGHGMNDDGEGYLLTNKARTLSDKENNINLEVVRLYMRKIVKSGHHVLVLLNACYSGAFLKRSFGGTFIPKLPGAHAITAGGTGELTWHDSKVGSGSIFFEKILKGLDNRADSLPKNANGSGDGLITVDELIAYIKQEVKISTNQSQNPNAGDISKDGSKGGFFFLNRDHPVHTTKLQNFDQSEKTPFGITTRNIESQGGIGDSDFELEYWRSIKNSDNPKEFQSYIKMYGQQGRFYDLAVIKKNKLNNSFAEDKPSPAIVVDPAKPEEKEECWDNGMSEYVTCVPGVFY